MQQRLLLLLGGLVLTFGALAACNNAIPDYTLDEQFTLNPGQSAQIKAERLLITFDEVLNDSRCPEDAICIWQGQVQCLLTISIDGVKDQLTLTQSGLSGTIFQAYHQYYLEFNVTPYPRLEENINASDYRLDLKITLIG